LIATLALSTEGYTFSVEGGYSKGDFGVALPVTLQTTDPNAGSIALNFTYRTEKINNVSVLKFGGTRMDGDNAPKTFDQRQLAKIQYTSWRGMTYGRANFWGHFNFTSSLGSPIKPDTIPDVYFGKK
jgi:hypothetical protein